MKRNLINIAGIAFTLMICGCSDSTESTAAVKMIDDSKSVHVTFAENNHMDISYYSNAEMTEQIETDDCYINVEDCIYASEPLINDSMSSFYVFEGFRIYEYDENGERKEHNISADNGSDIYTIRLPMNSTASEVSIVPVGSFTNRTLNMNDYYTDINGNKKELAGIWYVNGNVSTSETAEIEPYTPYSVKYEYDPDEYYFYSSEPKQAALNESSGIVYFDRFDVSDNVNDFSVCLRKYATAYVEDYKKLSRISLEGNDIDDTGIIDHVKAGDTIEMVSEKQRVYCDETDTASIEKISSGYSFVYHVPDNVSELHFKVRDWYTKKITFGIETHFNWWSNSEKKLFTIRAGNSEYDLTKFRLKKTVTLKESDKLEIIVSEDIKNYPGLCFEISVNGDTPNYITDKSDNRHLSYDFDKTDSVKIVGKYEEVDQ